MRRARPSLESLERRLVPTTAFFNKNGNLEVHGTSGSDKIYVTFTSSRVTVSGAGSFARSQVFGVALDAGAGNDTVKMLGSANVWTSIYGGPGNDTLFGGLSKDTLYGGSGHDVLWGLTGNDTLLGDWTDSIQGRPIASGINDD